MESISIINLNSGLNNYFIKDTNTRRQLTIESNIINITNLKNNVARGKDITEYFTDGSLYTRISDGSFDDLFVGDYFITKYNDTNIKFRIAGFNMYKYVEVNTSGVDADNHNVDISCYGIKDGINHVTLVPDESLTKCYMNTTNSTEGGYINSYMITDIIGGTDDINNTDTIVGKLYNIFNEHLVNVPDHYTTEVNTNSTNIRYTALSGASSSYNCFNKERLYATLMSETDLYKSQAFSSSIYENAISVIQLPLFRLMPQYRNPYNEILWLRDVASSTSFCAFDRTCKPTYLPANYSDGLGYPSVRPKLVIM